MPTTLCQRNRLDYMWDAATAGIIPPWDAERLYHLFGQHQAGTLNRPDANEYALRLMDLIGARINAHRLERSGLEVEEVGQNVLVVMIRRTAKMNLRHPGFKVMLKNLHLLIGCGVLDCLKRHQHATGRAKRESEIEGGGTPEGNFLDTVAAPPSEDCPQKHNIYQALRLLETRHIAGVGTRTAPLKALHSKTCFSLVYRGQLPPPDSTKGLTNGQRCLITSRIIRDTQAWIASAFN